MRLAPDLKLIISLYYVKFQIIYVCKIHQTADNVIVKLYFQAFSLLQNKTTLIDNCISKKIFKTVFLFKK